MYEKWPFKTFHALPSAITDTGGLADTGIRMRG